MSTPFLTRNLYSIPFLTLQQLLLLWVSYFISSPILAVTGVVVPTDTKLSVMVSGIGAKQLDVSTYLEVTRSPMGEASLQDILNLPDTAFEPLQDQTRFAQAGNNVYWIRASIRESSRNQYDEHSPWLLVLENPRLTGYQMYIANSTVRTAEAFQAVAPIRSRYLVYPIHLVANDTHQFYLKVGVQGVISIPAKIWQEEAYRLHKRKTLPGWGVLFGGLAALVLYNLLVMVSLRDKMYLYQSMFLSCGLMVAAYTEGFFLQFASDIALLQWHGFGQFSQCLALISAILFTRCFLDTFYNHPVVERILMLALLMTLIMALLIAGNLVSEPFYLAGMVFNGLLFFIPSAIAAFNVSDRATRYFLAGWSVYIVGYAVYQFAKLGMIPANDVTMHMKEFSLGILAVTLSLGIASQIQRERSQKVMGLSLQQETMLELKYTEEQIQKKVLRDTLKEFPELTEFKSVCRKVISSVSESQGCVMVMMELHHLGQVEKLLGHAARNELFTRAIKRLALVLRGIAGVVPLQEFQGQYVPMSVLDSCRFAFVLRGENVLQFNAAIEEIEFAMQRPFIYQAVDIELGISFGTAKLEENIHSFDDLFSEASRALQQDMKKNLLKRQGFEWGDQYNPHNIVLINQLREATQEDLVEVYFQPVYNLKTDLTCGVEVLTRWRTEQDEQISPNEIYYLAEMGGFVAELTLNVMRQAIRYFLDALGDGDQTVRLSVNLSPKCLRDERFLEDVGGLLSHYNMPAELLSFEIKEAAIIEDPNITRETLNRIRAMGIGLTIDEFAAAYSNPSYMSSLPVTEVKLDQRILAQVDNHSNLDSLLELIEMCRLQGIKLVMHGVEDEDTLFQLEEMGCTFAQGHYISAPVKAREFRMVRRVLKKGRYQRA